MESMEQFSPVVPGSFRFSELRRTRFTALAPDVRLACEYVEQLAIQTSTPINDWDVLKLFEGIDIGDRRAINQKFFEHAKSAPTQTPEYHAEINPILEAASEQIKTARLTRLSDRQRTVRSYISEAEHHHDLAKDKIQRAWQAQKDIYAIENQSASHIAEELREILKGGFWKFHGYTAGVLTLTTTSPITLTEKNQALGINRVVPMGYYRASLTINNMALRVHTHADNVVTRDYFHPYVSAQGTICWGDAASTASEALSRGNIKTVLELLASLLTHYSDDTSPYLPLVNFEHPEGGERCSRCDRPESICICLECHLCGSEYSEGSGRDCDCCYTCDNSECTCCRICESTDNDSCGCCFDCDRTEDAGHTPNCPTRVE